MEAREARQQYFEDYIKFEHIIRALYQRYTNTHNDFTRMSAIITNIKKLNHELDLHLPLDLINKHLLIRNTLAHAKSIEIITQHDIDLMKNIKKFNTSLSKR